MDGRTYTRENKDAGKRFVTKLPGGHEMVKESLSRIGAYNMPEFIMEDGAFNERRWILPFPIMRIPAGQQSSLAAQPQIRCIPECLVLHATWVPTRCDAHDDCRTSPQLGIACLSSQRPEDHLFVTSLQVGRDAQSLAQNPIPAKFFCTIPKGLTDKERELFDAMRSLPLDSADISQYVHVHLFNRSDYEMTVSGAYFCRVLL